MMNRTPNSYQDSLTYLFPRQVGDETHHLMYGQHFAVEEKRDKHIRSNTSHSTGLLVYTSLAQLLDFISMERALLTVLMKYDDLLTHAATHWRIVLAKSDSSVQFCYA